MEEIEFELTGNFQYDAGLFGLKRVLDFFEEDYRNDRYSLTLDGLLYSRLWNLYFLYSYVHLASRLKLFNEYSKSINTKKEKGQLLKSLKNLIDELDIENTVKSNKDKDVFSVIRIIKNRVNELSGNYDFASSTKFQEDVENLLVKPLPVFYVLDLSHQNFVANKQWLTLKRAVEVLEKKFNAPLESAEKTDQCDFCGRYKGILARKVNLFYAPNFLNFEWHGNDDTGITICNACTVSNFFIRFAFTNNLFIYSGNFVDIEADNSGLSELWIFFKKVMTKQVSAEKGRIVVEANFNNQQPILNIYHLTPAQLRFISRNQALFQDLHDKNFLATVKKADGKSVSFNFFNEVMKSYLNGIRDFITTIDRFAYFYSKQETELNKSGKSIYSGFRSYPLRLLLELQCILGGKNMEQLTPFREFGDRVRNHFWVKYKDNQNTFDNKMVSLSTFVRDSVKRGKASFIEAVIQLAITSGITIPVEVTNMLEKDETLYREAGYMLALAMLSYPKRPDSGSEITVDQPTIMEDNNTKGRSNE